MKIQRLNELVKSMNLQRIQQEIEKDGCRLAGKHGVWEFNPIQIARARNIERTEYHEDIFDDKKYVGEIYSQVEGQGAYEFIVITIEQIHRQLNNTEFPCEMLLFTNAPVNEEYEREQARIRGCQVCKRNFTRGELVELNGKRICNECFIADLNRRVGKGKSKGMKH